MLSPPFKNHIKITDLQEAAKTLDIPLNEKVYIPEEDSWTEKEVPVGIMNVVYLEHFPKAMSSSRGSLSTKRQFTTGQGRSGTRTGAGAIKLGGYDLFSLSFKEPAKMIKELHGVHSDNLKAKNTFFKKLLKTDEMPTIKDLPISSQESKTKKLIEVFFYGAMLEPNL
jgi:hypothetical protein